MINTTVVIVWNLKKSKRVVWYLLCFTAIAGNLILRCVTYLSSFYILCKFSKMFIKLFLYDIDVWNPRIVCWSVCSPHVWLDLSLHIKNNRKSRIWRRTVSCLIFLELKGSWKYDATFCLKLLSSLKKLPIQHKWIPK